MAGTVVKAYAARNYTYLTPRTSKYVEVNIPDMLPTVPQDNKTQVIGISSGYTANSNYPVSRRTVTITHALKLPLLSGTTCPTIFKKGTPFLLFYPTDKIEEGYLLYI